MIRLRRKSKYSCLLENVRWAEVGPLSDKDLLVIVTCRYGFAWRTSADLRKYPLEALRPSCCLRTAQKPVIHVIRHQKADVLPSGHVIDANMRIIQCFYSMGRTEDIWGEDCMEFRPERWFTNDGGIKHEPSYKFTAFHAGPRTCLGKEMGLIQIKMVAASIISRYHVELVKSHKVCPSDSVILNMKYGLKVKLLPINNI
ncbi:alkane hydroxylase MAH1-like protein [Tanacetum coccineum]